MLQADMQAQRILNDLWRAWLSLGRMISPTLPPLPHSLEGWDGGGGGGGRGAEPYGPQESLVLYK